jgi:cytochrome c oxidase cbb3-type subunit 3
MFKHYFELIENVSIWPVVSLSIFFGFFLLLILWLFKVDKNYINKMKNLPLDEEKPTKKQRPIKTAFWMLLALVLPEPMSAQASGNSGMDQETLVTFLVLVVVVIAILVLMVAIYTLSVLKMSLDEDSKEVTKKEEKQWTWFWERFNKSVAPEQEASILLDHNYDGIRELDNHLPPWWTALFYICIVFGVIYMFVYHVFDMAPLPRELYDISVAEAKVAAAERLAETGEEGGIDESTVAFSDDQAVIDSGKKIYDMQCASCHRNDGGGSIGPNLTDAYWLHGGSMSDIYKTIKYGVPQKGMISWEPLLSPEQMRDVSSYIMTLAGSDPPNAKAPQGDIYDGGADESGGETEAEAA